GPPALAPSPTLAPRGSARPPGRSPRARSRCAARAAPPTAGRTPGRSRSPAPPGFRHGSASRPSLLSEPLRDQLRQRRERRFGILAARANRDLAAELGREHHDPHDALAVDLHLFLLHPD